MGFECNVTARGVNRASAKLAEVWWLGGGIVRTLILIVVIGLMCFLAPLAFVYTQ
jgi:hypothetical protein